MESTSPLEKASEPPSNRWGHLVGTIIALLTLILPTFVIVYYSSQNNSIEVQPSPDYSLSKPDN